jgi:hypothetical protein
MQGIGIGMGWTGPDRTQRASMGTYAVVVGERVGMYICMKSTPTRSPPHPPNRQTHSLPTKRGRVPTEIYTNILQHTQQNKTTNPQQRWRLSCRRCCDFSKQKTYLLSGCEGSKTPAVGLAPPPVAVAAAAVALPALLAVAAAKGGAKVAVVVVVVFLEDDDERGGPPSSPESSNAAKKF